jgi:nitric oxide reductase large subunit
VTYYGRFFSAPDTRHGLRPKAITDLTELRQLTAFFAWSAAGIFSFLINLPIVSYYEIGTALTANHGHAAMMGVYGMLALGLALFCLRYLIPQSAGPRSGRRSASGRRTSAWPGCASRRCCRWGSSSSTSP